MQNILLIALFCCCFFAIALSQTSKRQSGTECNNNSTTNNLATCELCVGLGNTTGGGCGWCQAPTFGTCTTNSTCPFLNGVFITAASDCKTCYTNTSYTANRCSFASPTNLINSSIATCDSYNNPKPANNTNSTSTTGTTSSCSYSQKCLDATWTYACSLYCASCNATNGPYTASYTVCTPVSANYNTSCSAEIANGCLDPLPASSVSNDSNVCKPLIAGKAPQTGTSGTTATTGSTAATTTGSTTAVTTTGSTTAVTTTGTTGGTTARTTVGTTVVVTTNGNTNGNSNNSGAASMFVSVALLALLALLL